MLANKKAQYHVQYRKLLTEKCCTVEEVYRLDSKLCVFWLLPFRGGKKGKVIINRQATPTGNTHGVISGTVFKCIIFVLPKNVSMDNKNEHPIHIPVYTHAYVYSSLAVCSQYIEGIHTVYAVSMSAGCS